MEKNKKIQVQLVVNTLVKLFLFPLFIVGMLLRLYDKIFKKNQGKKRRVPYNFWY
ncbi:hypothetical protein IX317_002029 [Fusobacterium sp. DD29]|uniref:hypothetical protein n=1 Tax=unclassified Fusobacterium TaxID=2648384 RepID=UPI001B8D27DD|nr:MULTISPECIES: hypothetical protein [unclassified Fusobacterium]MBR8702044.1 hypothetical protein [Fusobacterium sp. DD45]MBR8711849.1 hypothetical protein [Fusobacterium sp. DD28]MBR8750310.1 hypothetical protein [Fusobacterium sp. DD29]MBR8752419.1 hypothetical protein [Fusobacterium sp. DD26]MBR8762554.1 hypothetical protein [Fusobacterium sp. DD25]